MPRKKKCGRPSKLTPENQHAICEALKEGNYRIVAGRSVGVSERVFNQWMKLGRRQLAKSNFKGRYALFVRAVLKAEQEAEMHAVRLVMRAAASDAKHAEWWLSRKVPERWAENSKLKMEAPGVEGGASVNIVITKQGSSE